jgi:hypothetical protein
MLSASIGLFACVLAYALLRAELLLIVPPSAMTVIMHVEHAAFLDDVSMLTWAEAHVLPVTLRPSALANAR